MPEANNVMLAKVSGLARNTVRTRQERYTNEGILRSFERRIDPAFLGYPLEAFIFASVKQRQLAGISTALKRIPEVVQVHGLAGADDLLVFVVARDAENLYRVAGEILEVDGVERTTTELVMGEFVQYRTSQLLSDSIEM